MKFPGRKVKGYQRNSEVDIKVFSDFDEKETKMLTVPFSFQGSEKVYQETV